jgi:hypothetical protein
MHLNCRHSHSSTAPGTPGNKSIQPCHSFKTCNLSKTVMTPAYDPSQSFPHSLPRHLLAMGNGGKDSGFHGDPTMGPGGSSGMFSLAPPSWHGIPTVGGELTVNGRSLMKEDPARQGINLCRRNRRRHPRGGALSSRHPPCSMLHGWRRNAACAGR